MRTLDPRTYCEDCGAYLQETGYGLRCPWARLPRFCGKPFRRTMPVWQFEAAKGQAITPRT